MKIRCPRCPLCSGMPAGAPLPLSAEQAWCDNRACAVMCWNPSMSLDENLTNATAHRLPDFGIGNGS